MRYRLALVLAGLVGGLAVAEAAVRLLDLGPRFDPIPLGNYQIIEDRELRYELVPGSIYLGTSINSDSMRDSPRVIAKSPASFRIACMGDSLTFGLYVRHEETYPAQVEALLNGRMGLGEAAYEVHNFGVTGYNIGQVAASLRLRAMKYRPDIIVYGYCLNDPSDYSAEFTSLRNHVVRPLIRQYLDEVAHQSSFLAAHSRLYRIGYYSWLSEAHAWGRGGGVPQNVTGPRMLDSTDKIYDSLHAPGPGWDRVLEGFQSINSTAGKSDIPVFVVLFPLLDQLSDYSYVQIHEKVREAAEEQGFIVVDLLPTFQKASTESTMPLWLDELHPTPTGYRIAAETLLAALEDTRVLPARHYSAKSGVDK